MAKSFNFHALFDCDVLEAALWYKSRGEGLDRRFANKVSERIRQIKAMPERFGKFEDECYFARVEGFPYIILFDVTDDELIFYGVVHRARSPENWLDRLNDV